MINFDDVTKGDTKEHIPNWPKIPHHPCRISRNGGSGSEKTNSIFNLIIHQLYLIIHQILTFKTL